jgi:hypothetical protein
MLSICYEFIEVVGERSYLDRLFGKTPPPVFSETDFCTAPFATFPATLPMSASKVGFDVVP